MSKRQNSHSVRAAALCCSKRARNVISPLSPLGRIARIADSNCPSRRRELHKIPLWLRDSVSLRDLRSEIDWFRFLRLFDAGGLILDENRWDEKAGLRRDAVRSKVIDVPKAQEIK